MRTFFRQRVYKERKFKVRTYNRRGFSYSRAEPEHDFLKYLRIARYWVKHKHKLSYAEFELLCFLYSENIFTEQKYEHYSQTMSFSSNKIWKMIELGWIRIFRQKQRGYEPLYELSAKGKGVMRSVYKKLLGQEPIESFVSEINMVRKSNSRYSERQYTRVARSMNADFKEQHKHLGSGSMYKDLL